MASTITTLLLITIILHVSASILARTNLYSKPNYYASPQESGTTICKTMVEIQGYICEEHQVTTKDGYILGLQRIPVGRFSSNKTANKQPILLQHGVLMNAASWMFNSPNQSLGFILADNGFDVWLANTRGTDSSRGHLSLNPNDPAYWEWSWDELVAYDLPAFVDYVHNQTGQSLHYVGYSLGTLIGFTSFSQDKLINNIKSGSLLSPVAYLGNMSSELLRTAANLYLAEALYGLGVREIIPRGHNLANLIDRLCDETHIDCLNLLTPITGPNCCLNTSKTDIILNEEPQSTSTKNAIHLMQMVRSGSIAMFDYGEDNMKHYAQASPPIYNMTNIPKNIPLFVSYGAKDLLSDMNDVHALLDNFRDHDKDKLVVQFIEDYAHLDFVMAVNAYQRVYDPLLAFLSQH